MRRRARLLAVLTILTTGSIGVISSTQTWLVVTLVEAEQTLDVAGAAAVPLLAPLSLAALALGGALTIVGRALRYVFGVLTLAIGCILMLLAARIATEHPTAAVAGTVTEATGIAGEASVSALVAMIGATGWPAVTVVAALLLAGAGILTLATAHRWRSGGRRYETDASASGPRPADAERTDAIDSWDDLSRGEDPTARPLD
ncbi:hypothetical protein GCM10022200_03770 [Microbacterium awajiense]|uniref:Peptidase n=1 Tax=Microbacterium awajiense TaxID=415214 RepID=A0ABP7A4H7_9MICO